MHSFQTHATFITNETHRDLFFNGHLIEEWSRVYPMLFDAQDLQIALNQKHMGYHYYEWFTAVLLYHTTGLLSLVEAYAYKSHPSKRKVLESLVTGEVLDFIASRGVSSVTQCPDLLVYSTDYSDWFFCEVKGPRDRLRKSQVLFFEELSRVTGKEIRVVQFQALETHSPA
jgi:hypothetical protein